MKQPSLEQFLAACGAPAPLQFEVEHVEQRHTRRITLSQPFALVGRDERADLPLNDARVSLRHAYLQMVAGRLWWMDLDSRGGTHGRDGQQSAGLLERGHSLRIGPFHVRLLDGCVPEAIPSSSLADPLSSEAYALSSLPPVRLDFLEGSAKPFLWTVDRSLALVGRASCCKVRLHSPLISRTHCALLRTPEGLWVIDLLGRDGVHVNGTTVRYALLEDVDELRIGQFLIRVSAPTTSRNTGFSSPGTSIVPSRPLVETLPAELGSLLSPVSSLAPASPALVPSAGGVNEALLLPLITQFSLMQQQMFEQFQQALTMMAQMFSGLHRDQMQLIREEMNQLRELTRELQNLPAELARHTPTISPDAVTAPLPAPSAASVSAPSLPTSAPSLPPTPSRPPEPSPSAPPSAPTQADAEVHAWLSQRLASLQQERQSRWQKIVNLLTGTKTEQTVP